MGARFTYGFLLDPRGRQLAEGVFDQLNNGALEGLKFGCMHALLRVGDVALNFLKSPDSAVLKGDRLEEAHKRERFFFGIFQRDPKCMEKLDAVVVEEQSKYGGQGDTFLAHWKMSYFTQIVDDRRTDFLKNGERGPTRLAEGISNFSRWGNNRVYLVRACVVLLRCKHGLTAI